MKLSFIPWILAIVAIAALAFYYWQQQRTLSHLLTLKNEELQAANLALGRAKTEITTQAKVHATAMANLDKSLKKEIKDREAAVMLYAKLVASYNTKVKEVQTLNKIITELKDQNGKPIEFEIPKGDLFIKTPEGELIPIESLSYNYEDYRITIHGNIKKNGIDNSLEYTLHQKFSVQFVETSLPTGGKNHYAKLYELDDKGERVGELTLDSFEVLRGEDLPDRFMWFNPKLDLMVGAGLNNLWQGTVVGDIGVSLMAYGKTDNDLTWRFLRMGMGITQRGFSLTGSPAQWNFGSVLPLISNTWLSPYGGYDFGASAAHFGLGIGLMF